MPIHVGDFPEDAGIATKTLLPVAIAEHDDWIGTGDFPFRGKYESPEIGSNAKHLEKLAAGEESLNRAGDSVDCQAIGAVSRARESSESDCVHVGEYGARLLTQLTEFGYRELGIKMRRVAGKREECEVERMLNGERLDHEGIDHAEDGGVGADPERERNHRDGSKARRLAERAPSETQVLKQDFEEGQPAFGPIFFLNCFHGAKLDQSLATSFGRG